MRYVIAIVLPPFALLGLKKPVQFVFNLLFWLLSIPLLFFGIGAILWLLCTLHAVVVCRTQTEDQRFNRLVDAIEKRSANAASTHGPAAAQVE